MDDYGIKIKVFDYFLFKVQIALGLLLSGKVVLSEVNHVAYPKNSNCLSSSSTLQYYFDISGLQCKLCEGTIARNSIPEYDSNIISQNENIDDVAYECNCPTNALKIKNTCTLRELQSGTCKSFECLLSSSTTNNVCHKNKQDISLSGEYCVSCSSAPSYKASYDEVKKECSCNNPVKSISTKTPVVTRKLVELYDDNEEQKPLSKMCVVCPHGSAVLSDELLLNDSTNTNTDGGQKYYTTAGRKYNPNAYDCAYCPDPHMFFDTDYNCLCKDGYTIVGEFSIGEQSCIQKIPTISSQYAKAAFRFLKHNKMGSSSAVDTNTVYYVDSIIYSHYYLKAASKCEYLESISIYKESLSSCQTLGNLCVLNLYDLSSSPCRQFQNIIAEDRDLTTSSYHKQEDWKYSLPWLYYLDEANHIITDRGIQMRMSFESGASFTTNKLRFKLAKYTLDGMFLGLEDLTNQFFYCNDKKSDYGDNANSIDHIIFGTSKRFEWKCDLTTLIKNNEMYFYDMYLVDEGDTSTISSCNNQQNNDDSIDSECLYPIPVLNRNFIQGLTTPNMNRIKEDSVDDRYTRRFFLFDNVSGRSAMNGHEILRYAKNMVLQTTIQNEDPSKIHPPRLIIEYAEVFVNSVVESNVDSIMFKMEYTMDTKNFWNAVKILVGFVSAIAALIWILRVNNWFCRNNRPMDDVRRNNYHNDPEYYDTTSRILVMNFIHFIMLALHSFVIAFTPFIVGLCTYWFLFFKLQKEVFLMLPPVNDEFRPKDDLTSDEYWFYKFFFHALFWCQNTYTFYTIFRQSMIHIFFIDWEKSNCSGNNVDSLGQKIENNHSVSTWRSVLIANKWNDMQVMRKTCAEFNLLCITFFLIGLKLYNNSISKPNLNRATDEGSYPNCVLRFANNVWYWTILSFMQFLWNLIFYERYWTESQSQSFIDVCTLAKISVFILDEPYHGYYLHCRSPYEYADCSMAELIEHLQKEGSGLTTDRGLDVPNAPEDCQVFEIFTSRNFHEKVIKIYDNLPFDASGATNTTIESSRLNLLQPARSKFLIQGNGNTGNDTYFKGVENVYEEVSHFLQCFIDQSPTPINNGLRYVIRQPTFLERFLQIAPFDVRVKNHKCIFYPDQKSSSRNNSIRSTITDYDFLNVLFLGIEFDLLLHDILMYNICDLIFQDVAISALLTYGMCLLRNFIRKWLGCRNIANKACIDQRFFF